jgi:Aminomethyltransferase folate-binding domain
MTEIQRRSPVSFKVIPMESEIRDNWTVILKYRDEGEGPYLVDLSHKNKWDLQDNNLTHFSPCDVDVPETPGTCVLKGGVLINRMSRTQATLWHLAEKAPELPDESAYTNITESKAFLALFGPNIFSITEKLTSLDFLDPQKKAPFLLQGPFSQIPCQIVILEKSVDNVSGILLTFSRGYAQSMVHSILKAGEEFGLRPAGENQFARWLSRCGDYF